MVGDMFRWTCFVDRATGYPGAWRRDATSPCCPAVRNFPTDQPGRDTNPSGRAAAPVGHVFGEANRLLVRSLALRPDALGSEFDYRGGNHETPPPSGFQPMSCGCSLRSAPACPSWTGVVARRSRQTTTGGSPLARSLGAMVASTCGLIHIGPSPASTLINVPRAQTLARSPSDEKLLECATTWKDDWITYLWVIGWIAAGGVLIAVLVGGVRRRWRRR